MSAPVLVVDDEPQVLRVLTDLVQRAGSSARTANSATEALALAAEETFSAFVIDYQMPDLLAPDLLRKLAALQPDASRIVMTGMPSLDAVLRAVNEGEIYRFVTKPWLTAEMVSTLRGAIQRYDLLLANQQLREESIQLNRRLAETNSLLDAKVCELQEQRRLLGESRAELEKNYHNSLELCRRILNTFNPLLAAQARMSAEIMSKLLAQGQFLAEERSALHIASRLYDLGLTGVPAETVRRIQDSDQRLDEETESLRRHHPIYGQTLAAFVDPNPLLGDTIRAHHEHYDGTGYPDALSAERIPWAARCLAVVVAYVEKISAHKTHEEALDSMLSQAGRQFDPKALQLFLACVRGPQEMEELRQVRLEELRPGMRLASDFTTPSGLVLYPKGLALDEETIGLLKKTLRFQPSGGRMTVDIGSDPFVA